MKGKIGIMVFLVAICALMGPASAATVSIPAGSSNTDIQTAINGASSGDTISFASGTYTGISLTINKNLNMLGNGANLVGSGSSIMNIAGTSGVTINGFNININSVSGDGITGSSVTNCIIDNNNITNGGDAINIFSMYKNLTITHNTITNMVSNYGDAISLVNHDLNLETTTQTNVSDNVIDNAIFGIFLGGNFNGTVSGNTITNTQVGMNLTGKHNASLGSLNANIVNNVISGISMEAPNIVYLNLSSNNITQLGSTGYSILINQYYHKDGSMYITYNNFTNNVSADFRHQANTWSNNFLNGVAYPQFP